MPPLPKPKAPGSGSGTPSPRTRAGGGRRESSSAPDSAASPRRGGRATKAETLEVKVARMYNMFGTMLSPMGRFYPALGPLGNNLKELSGDAAEAWVELAEQDKRVKEALESLTSASVWGNVIGVHFAIFSAALPGGEVVAPMMRTMGEVDIAAMFADMSPAEQAAAQALAAQMMGTPQGAPARDRGTGGPGDTVQAAPAPEYDPTATPGPTAAPPVQQATATAAPAGIVTAEQLGVQSPGDQGSHPFPADPSPPNGSAG